VASQQEEQRLAEKRRSRDLPFELHPIRSASTADFDLDLFLRTYLPSAIDADTLAENGRTVEQQLTSLRFLSAGAEPAPTVLGILTIGRDPTAFLPGAYVQFVRYDGPDLSDPVIDSAVVAGPLPDLLSALEQRISGHLHVGMDLDARKHAARPDYPVAALRQIVRNAILHRTYEGTAAPVRVYWFAARIEVHSPGGPFGIVTVENFGRPGVTDYRNPYLAEAMRNLGYVEKFGVGLAIARRELAANGNPPPEFEVNPSHVVAVVRRRA
jgi:ATP-dependent DNA helicase RecG